jgi:hypothetical protein
VIGTILNRALGLIGLKIVRRHHDQLFYQHSYGSGGFDRYRELQIFHNRRKLNQVWADAETLSFIAGWLKEHRARPEVGICHGSRNGFEQRELARLLDCEVIGTDISNTASQFPNTSQWDFHEPKPEWVGRFSFVYTNSFDHAFDPQRALTTWCDQLADHGVVFIEHTMAHSPKEASEMDPFGAHPMIMPYLIFEWGRGKFELIDILKPPRPKSNNGLEAWVFAVGRMREEPLRMDVAPTGGGDKVRERAPDR